MLAGYLLTLSSFGWPLLIGGMLKAVYDVLLLLNFRSVRPPEEHEGGAAVTHRAPGPLDAGPRAGKLG
jgi:hypothetical protein